MIEIDTKSPAKINLYLRILNKRNDGYHNIETSFQYIDLYDFLSFKDNMFFVCRLKSTRTPNNFEITAKMST